MLRSRRRCTSWRSVGDGERLFACLAPEVELVEQPPILDPLPHDRSDEFSARFEELPLDVHTHLMNRPWVRSVVALDKRDLWTRALPSRWRATRSYGSRPGSALHLSSHAVLHHSSGSRSMVRACARRSRPYSSLIAAVIRRSRGDRAHSATWLAADALPAPARDVRPGRLEYDPRSLPPAEACALVATGRSHSHGH